MTLAGRSRLGRSRRPTLTFVLALSALVAGACLGTPVARPTDMPSGAIPSPSTIPSAAPSTAVASETPRASAPAPVAGELAGSWRVRRVLALDDRSVLVPGATFTDEVYKIRASCETEPCPEIVVTATPAGRSRPVTETTLTRDGDTYVSAASAGVDVPCRNGTGDRVPGGATATTTMRLWLTSVRPAGTAVDTITLAGALELALAPTELGVSAGCTADAAAYDLSGKRGAVAVIDAPRPPSEVPAGVKTAPVPSVDAAIAGAKVVFFDVEGTTVEELADSVGRGALQACGGIQYEWLEGDPTPSACTITHFPDIEDEIRERTGANGACTLQADPKVRFTVYLPRWTAPARVPAILVDWWRETVEFIRVHEAGHVKISLAATDRLDGELDGADCDAADDIVRDWARELSQEQEAFDRKEYQRDWPAPPRGA